MNPLTRADLDNRFRFHPATPTTGPKHDLVRELCLDLARQLVEEIPAGREQALAITRLEEVMFWSNAAVARTDGAR
jgi:hypothetical protein